MTPATNDMRRFWHVPWLCASVIASVVTVKLWNPSFGMVAPMLAAVLLGAIAVSHFAAGVLGFFLLRRSWRRLALVTLLALLLAIVFSVGQAREAWYLRYQAVYDRFRDNLDSPIPASVSNLAFIPLKEACETHLMFRFTISPEDLDKIIRSRGFVETDRGGFRRPDDLFTHPEYLPLAEPTTFYTLNELKRGYPDKGIGEGYTLKVSVDRRNVIFRRESAPYYLYKYWETDVERDSEKEFLAALHGSGSK